MPMLGHGDGIFLQDLGQASLFGIAWQLNHILRYTWPGRARCQHVGVAKAADNCSCCADMNVGYVLDEAQLTRYFSQFGTVTDCYLPVRIMTASAVSMCHHVRLAGQVPGNTLKCVQSTLGQNMSVTLPAWQS